jgi:hypothetical protein
MTGLSDQQRGGVRSNFLASTSAADEKTIPDEEIIRAVAHAIPAEKRAEVLAMLKTIVGTNTTDTLRGSFDA